jgi:hypothetical protein
MKRRRANIATVRRCDGWPAGPAPSRLYSTPIGSSCLVLLTLPLHADAPRKGEVPPRPVHASTCRLAPWERCVAPRRARMVVTSLSQRVNGTGIQAGSSPQKPSGHAPGWLFAFRLAFSHPGCGQRLSPITEVACHGPPRGGADLNVLINIGSGLNLPSQSGFVQINQKYTPIWGLFNRWFSDEATKVRGFSYFKH